MYIHMYTYTSTYIYVHTYTCRCICTHVCVYVCMYVCMYVCTRGYIHTYIHTYICIHTCIHTYIHTYILTYIHTYIHTYTHTYIYIYICIYTLFVLQVQGCRKTPVLAEQVTFNICGYMRTYHDDEVHVPENRRLGDWWFPEPSTLRLSFCGLWKPCGRWLRRECPSSSICVESHTVLKARMSMTVFRHPGFRRFAAVGVSG